MYYLNQEKKYSTVPKTKNIYGQILLELLLTMGILIILIPILLISLISSREGKVREIVQAQAVALLKETDEAVKSVKNRGWSYIPPASIAPYHPQISGGYWSLVSGSQTVNGLIQEIYINDVYRDYSGNIVSSSSGVLDPSTKKIDIKVSRTTPTANTLSATLYITQSLNYSQNQTTVTDFTAGTTTQTAVVTGTPSDGDVVLANNNKAKWCSPEFTKDAFSNDLSIDLPDGPPVAVDATASAIASTPNDVFVATSPYATSSVKLAYVNVTADTDPPYTSLQGIFTLDPTKYSNPSYVPANIGLDNNFRTNGVKYYKSPSGKTYAIITTNLPDKEVIAVQVNDNNNFSQSEYQDYDANPKIYKYWTYFNTKIYSTAYNSPAADSAETSNAGDNNGYQTNSTNAYIYDGSYAIDSNSGNNTGTNCSGTDKDKHRYYNYGFSLPSGATINGIEMRLDAKADSTTGSPKICVQLSWDAGATWTTTQSTAGLTTSETAYILGGSSDTWGRTWNNTDINNSNFRVRVINVASSTSRDFSLDRIGVKIYYNGTFTTPNDQAPYGYGATALKIYGDKGYILSGGFLYAFDLSNIDSKSPTNSLDQIGCRIQVEGSDCNPKPPSGTGGANGSWEKYTDGETGTSYNNTGTPSHSDCSDGGNIALYADESLDVTKVASSGNNTYAFIAIGGQANDELDVIKIQNPPSGSNLESATCGVSDGSDWKEVGHLDFNPNGSSEEAANSVYVKTDGSRVYMTSNGGTDSKQFYVIDTTTPATPKFLATSGGIPTKGFYNGESPAPAADKDLYPKRSLTVLNGLRAILVGKDGVANGNNAEEYQVLNMDPQDGNSENTPKYCSGLNFDAGFNDLVSVSEADYDNFVYMITNTQGKYLKVIQGGADDAVFVPAGQFESNTIDATQSSVFNRFHADVSTPGDSQIKLQLAAAAKSGGVCPTLSTAYNFLGPDMTNSTFFTPIGSTISAQIPFGNYGTSPAYQNPAECFRYKAWLTSSSDQHQTPRILDFFLNYSQ